jgi:hypothetical protein
MVEDHRARAMAMLKAAFEETSAKMTIEHAPVAPAPADRDSREQNVDPDEGTIEEALQDSPPVGSSRGMTLQQRDEWLKRDPGPIPERGPVREYAREGQLEAASGVARVPRRYRPPRPLASHWGV